MSQFKGAKIAYVVFCISYFSLVANIVYLGVTGKHIISNGDIKGVCKSRGKVETVEYATRGEIYTSDNEIVASNVQKFKLIAIVSDKRPGYGNKKAHVVDVTETANKINSDSWYDPVSMAQNARSNRCG